MSKENLEDIVKEIKILTLKMVSRAKTPHVGSSFSVIEILTALYFKILKIDPNNLNNLERDRFILSKGHAVAGLYATLAIKGFINPEKLLNEFYSNGSYFPGHVSRGEVPGIEVSAGSLGHGLSMGVGMALAAKKDNKNYRTFVLLSDGECDEGSNWEAILFAGHHKLDNLIAIIDYNKWQSFGKTKDVLELEPFTAKWKDFNWGVQEVDGHDIRGIVSSLNNIPFESSRPSVLIAHTIKGKGLPLLEDKLESHYFNISPEEAEKIIKEINYEKRIH